MAQESVALARNEDFLIVSGRKKCAPMTSLGIAHESEILRVHGQRRRSGLNRRGHDHWRHWCWQRWRGRQRGDKNVSVSTLIFQAEKMLQDVQAQGRVVYGYGSKQSGSSGSFHGIS